MSEIAILILAAGSSSRMGKVKQLLPYKHTTLLGWAIEQALESVADEVICVLGAEVNLIEKSIQSYDVKTIYNENYKDGLSSSIALGIENLQNTKAVLIMLADQPNISSNFLNRLLEKYSIQPNKIIASNYGNSVGVPAVFPKKYYPDLLKLKGDKGARNVLSKFDVVIVKIEPHSLLDIDTLEDYRDIIS